tara:strand:+ start:606 stop:1025 length:420 start_codon:yes stop_codon:yes gene_type:complete
MNTFKVPKIKPDSFNFELFKILCNSIDELGFENNKVPTSIKFTGVLGKELFDIITELKWDLASLNPIFLDSNYSQILIGYDKALTRTENIGVPNQGIDGKIIEGFPSANTVRHIISSSIDLTFTKESTSRPEIAIQLIR